MSQKKILFIAYLYPPAGGKALPGVQRTVKFVRYIWPLKKYVLSLKKSLYPDFFSKDNATELPVNDEKIIRTGTIDIFEILLKLRALIKNKKRPTAPCQEKSPAEPLPINSNENKGFAAKIKDTVSEILRYPDYAYGWIFPALWQGRKLVQKNKIDIVFTTGMPWTSLVVGLGLKKMTGVKLIVDFRDPWVNNPFAVNKPRLIKAMDRCLERKLVDCADIISLNTDELRKDFVLRYPQLPQDKFITLPNGYDEFDFKGLDSQIDASESNKLILSHAGYLYGLRDPKPILDAIKNKNISDGKILFQQMGYTDLDYDLDEFVRQNSLQDAYENLGPLPYTQCLKNMINADILLIIQQDTKTQIPSKIYEYIYLNKPILTIASKDGALGQMISQYEFGDIFEPDDIDGIAKYFQQKIKEKQAQGNVSAKYENREKFDVKNITQNLTQIINKVCN